MDYMNVAKCWAQHSHSKKLKVGAVIAKDGVYMSRGVNGQPSWWHTIECEDENGNTYPSVLHAEEVALEHFVKTGDTPLGATMYVTHAPCLKCAIRIIQAGIKKVVYCYEYKDQEGIKLLRDQGIEIEKKP